VWQKLCRLTRKAHSAQRRIGVRQNMKRVRRSLDGFPTRLVANFTFSARRTRVKDGKGSVHKGCATTKGYTKRLGGRISKEWSSGKKKAEMTR